MEFVSVFPHFRVSLAPETNNQTPVMLIVHYSTDNGPMQYWREVIYFGCRLFGDEMRSLFRAATLIQLLHTVGIQVPQYRSINCSYCCYSIWTIVKYYWTSNYQNLDNKSLTNYDEPKFNPKSRSHSLFRTTKTKLQPNLIGLDRRFYYRCQTRRSHQTSRATAVTAQVA